MEPTTTTRAGVEPWQDIGYQQARQTLENARLEQPNEDPEEAQPLEPRPPYAGATARAMANVPVWIHQDGTQPALWSTPGVCCVCFMIAVCVFKLLFGLSYVVSF